MAHQIESMFYIGETPWHGLGRQLIEAPTTAVAIRQAGLDWTVREMPLYTNARTPGSTDFAAVEEVDSHKALVRASDGSLLGVVGSRYRPLQNEEAFGFFDPLVQNGLVMLETAGSLQQGKRVWILARIADNSDISIVGDDIVRKFILLSNSHDGTLAVRVGFTPIRVVCANTLAMAHNNGESQLIRLRHSSAVVKNLDGLRDMINVANQSFEATADQYRRLAHSQINAADLRAYIKTVIGQAEVKDDELSTRAENQIQTITDLFESGRGHDLPGIRGTVWSAYNAVTEYLAHQSTPDADKRYSSLWYGGNAARNELALTEAIKLAA